MRKRHVASLLRRDIAPQHVPVSPASWLERSTLLVQGEKWGFLPTKEDELVYFSSYLDIGLVSGQHECLRALQRSHVYQFTCS